MKGQEGGYPLDLLGRFGTLGALSELPFRELRFFLFPRLPQHPPPCARVLKIIPAPQPRPPHTPPMCAGIKNNTRETTETTETPETTEIAEIAERAETAESTERAETTERAERKM